MPWLSKEQAAKHLGVCKSTIENLESRGMLKGYRLFVGSKKPIVRFRQEDLDNLFLKRPKGRPLSSEHRKAIKELMDKIGCA